MERLLILNNMNKKALGIIIVVVVVILLIWAGMKKEPEATGPVRIGGAYILSGPASAVGELQKNATAMAVKEINDAGGINGRTLEVVQQDAQYDSKNALNAYQALKQQGITLFIADGSPVVAPIQPAVLADGGFMMVPAATLPSYFDGSDRTCRIGLTAKNFGPGLVDAMMAHGYTKAAIFLPDNEAGRGLYTELEKALIAKGGKVTIAEFYSASGNGDYRTNISKIKEKAKDVDVIMLQQVLNTIEPMFKQFRDLGVNKPIITDYYTINNPAFKNLSLANGIEFVDYDYAKTDVAGDTKAANEFKTKYRAQYNADPSFFAASTYDAIYLIADAVKAVGDDPAKVGAYVSKLQNYRGVTGTMSFNSDCEVDRVMKVNKVENGMIVIGK